MVRSIGLGVEEGGLGFVWFPNSLPFLVRDPSKCKFECDESKKFYASRATQNVPFLRNNFTVIPGLPATASDRPGDIEVVTPPELAEEPAEDVGILPFEPAVEPSEEVGDLSSVAAEIREVAPEDPLPRLPDRALVAREQALPIEHQMTNFPKNALCDICNRARLYTKRVRSHRIEDPESDLPPPESFAAELAMDHLIVSKGSDGKEWYF